MPESTDILEFSNVTLLNGKYGQAGMRQITFRLSQGWLLLIRVENGNEYLPLADAAEGLLAPKSGLITWRGTPWHAFAPQDELKARARIGRVFEKSGWISNLNVIENVTLSQRHHTERPELDIIHEADSFAKYFGLAQVSRQRPAFVSERELRITEWVRAFIGKPLLLLLERPEKGVMDDSLPKLIDVVQTALHNGTAVVWQTDRDMVWNTSICTTEIRYRMQGANMVLVEDQQP